MSGGGELITAVRHTSCLERDFVVQIFTDRLHRIRLKLRIQSSQRRGSQRRRGKQTDPFPLPYILHFRSPSFVFRLLWKQWSRRREGLQLFGEIVHSPSRWRSMRQIPLPEFDNIPPPLLSHSRPCPFTHSSRSKLIRRGKKHAMGRAHDQLRIVYPQSGRINVSKFLASGERKQKADVSPPASPARTEAGRDSPPWKRRNAERRRFLNCPLERSCRNYGLMFWFRWKMFSGSYRRLRSLSRA